jgi:hypothetical protein
LTKNNLVIFIWGALLIGNLMLLVKQIFIDRKDVRTFTFLMMWLVLSLVPLYKLFNIANDLQGSRLAYLPSVPLSALLCMGYAANLKIIGQFNYRRVFALVLLVSIAGAGLLVNNSAWIKAQTISSNILKELDNLSLTLNSKDRVYIVGLPDQINGAYVCRNALDGMSKYPQISKTINYCFNLDEINHVFPFGYARQSMLKENKEGVNSKFYIWDAEGQKFVNCALASDGLLDTPIYLNLDKDILGSDQDILIDLKGRNCLDLNCLIIDLTVDNLDKGKRSSKVSNLFYTNDICPEFDLLHRFDFPLEHGNGEYKLVIPLYGQADWAFGNKAHCLKLTMPRTAIARITNIWFEPIEKMMPRINFASNANQNSLGFIELSNSFQDCQIEYDSSKVLGANKVMLEFTASDQTFALANETKQPQSFHGYKELKGLKGLISLNKKDFPSSGIYEIRLRSFDNNNKMVGMAGNHIVVTVK